jgi:hypothetical protein
MEIERYDVPRERRFRHLGEFAHAQEILNGAGWRVTEIVSRQPPSPDCEGVLNGKPCGIEVTELIHMEAQKERRLAEDRGYPRYVPHPWTAAELIDALQILIDRKAERMRHWPDAERYGGRFLVIQTDEFHLTGDFVARAVANHRFNSHCFTAVALGLSYHPTNRRFFRLLAGPR